MHTYLVRTFIDRSICHSDRCQTKNSVTSKYSAVDIHRTRIEWHRYPGVQRYTNYAVSDKSTLFLWLAKPPHSSRRSRPMVRVDVVIRFTIWLCNHLKATTLVHNIGDVDGIVPSNSSIRTLVNCCCGGVEPQKSLSSVSNFSRSHGVGST